MKSMMGTQVGQTRRRRKAATKRSKYCSMQKTYIQSANKQSNRGNIEEWMTGPSQMRRRLVQGGDGVARKSKSDSSTILFMVAVGTSSYNELQR